MSQNLIHLDHRPDHAVEAAVLHCLWQADAKYLQQSSHFICQINGLAQQGLSRAQKRPNPVRLPALHVNGAEPACPQNLGNAAGIIAIGLIAHR